MAGALYIGTATGGRFSSVASASIWEWTGSVWKNLAALASWPAAVITVHSLAEFGGNLYAYVITSAFGEGQIWKFDILTREWSVAMATVPVGWAGSGAMADTPGQLIVWKRKLWAFMGTGFGFGPEGNVVVAVLQADGKFHKVTDNSNFISFTTSDVSEWGGIAAITETSKSGQSELVVGAWSTDAWATFDGTTLTYRDRELASSCVWCLFDDPAGYCHSGNEYGWVYVSNDARRWTSLHISPFHTPSFPPNRTYNEDISGDQDEPTRITGIPEVSLWTMFKLGTQLYGGTCSRFGTSPCDVRKWLGNTWIDLSGANRVAIHNVTVQEQGFISSVVAGTVAFIGTGVPWYYNAGQSDESKVYQFNGRTLVELTNPNPTINSLNQFDHGVVCMTGGAAVGPPLRQKQRDDGLGITSGVRQGRGSRNQATSRQSSARQRDGNTYW